MISFHLFFVALLCFELTGSFVSADSKHGIVPLPARHRCLDWNFGGWSPILYHLQNGQLNQIKPMASNRHLKPIRFPIRMGKQVIGHKPRGAQYKRRPAAGPPNWTPFYQPSIHDVPPANVIRYTIRPRPAKSIVTSDKYDPAVYQMITPHSIQPPMAPPVTRYYLHTAAFTRPSEPHRQVQLVFPVKRPYVNYMQNKLNRPTSISSLQSYPQSYSPSKEPAARVVQQVPVAVYHSSPESQSVPATEDQNEYTSSVHVKTDPDKPLTEFDLSAIKKGLMEIAPHVDAIYRPKTQSYRPSTPKAASSPAPQFPSSPPQMAETPKQPTILVTAHQSYREISSPPMVNYPSQPVNYENSYTPLSNQQSQPIQHPQQMYPPQQPQQPSYNQPPPPQQPAYAPAPQPQVYPSSQPQPQSYPQQQPPFYGGQQQPSYPQSQPATYPAQSSGYAPEPAPESYAVQNENYANEQDSGLFRPLLDQSRKGKEYISVLPYKDNDPLNLNVIHLIAHQKQLPLIVPISTIFSSPKKNEYSMGAPAPTVYSIGNQNPQQPLVASIVTSAPSYPQQPHPQSYSQPEIFQDEKKRRCNKKQQQQQQQPASPQYTGPQLQYSVPNGPNDGSVYDAVVPINYPAFGQRKPSLNLGYNQMIVDANAKPIASSQYPPLPPQLPIPEIPSLNEGYQQQLEQQEQYPEQPEQKYQQELEQKYQQEPEQKYQQEPEQKYQQEPEQKYQQEPEQKYQQEPEQKYQQEPEQKYQQEPEQKYQQEPEQKYQQKTLQKYDEEPKYQQQPEKYQQPLDQLPKFDQQQEQNSNYPLQQQHESAHLVQQPEQSSRYAQEPHPQYEQQKEPQYQQQQGISKESNPQINQFLIPEQPANYEQQNGQQQYTTTSAPQIVQEIEQKLNYQPPINLEQPAFASFLSNLPTELFTNYNQSDSIYTQNVNQAIPMQSLPEIQASHQTQRYEDAAQRSNSYEQVVQHEPIESNKREKEQYEQPQQHQYGRPQLYDQQKQQHQQQPQQQYGQQRQKYEEPPQQGKQSNEQTNLYQPNEQQQMSPDLYPPNRPYEAHRLQPVELYANEEYNKKSGHSSLYEPPVQDTQQQQQPDYKGNSYSDAQSTLSQLQQVRELIASVRNNQAQPESSSANGYGQRLAVAKSEPVSVNAQPDGTTGPMEKSELVRTEIGMVRRRWRAHRRGGTQRVQHSPEPQPTYRASASQQTESLQALASDSANSDAAKEVDKVQPGKENTVEVNAEPAASNESSVTEQAPSTTTTASPSISTSTPSEQIKKANDDQFTSTTTSPTSSTPTQDSKISGSASSDQSISS